MGAIALAGVAALAWGWLKGRVPVLLLAFGLPLLVGGGPVAQRQHFWQYALAPDKGLYRTTARAHLQAEPKPFPRPRPRALVQGVGVYTENVLMAFDESPRSWVIRQRAAYYDELLGGRPGPSPAAIFAHVDPTVGLARGFGTWWSRIPYRFPDTTGARPDRERGRYKRLLVRGRHNATLRASRAGGGEALCGFARSADARDRACPDTIAWFCSRERTHQSGGAAGPAPPSPSHGKVTNWDAGG